MSLEVEKSLIELLSKDLSNETISVLFERLGEGLDWTARIDGKFLVSSLMDYLVCSIRIKSGKYLTENRLFSSEGFNKIVQEAFKDSDLWPEDLKNECIKIFSENMEECEVLLSPEFKGSSSRYALNCVMALMTPECISEDNMRHALRRDHLNVLSAILEKKLFDVNIIVPFEASAYYSEVFNVPLISLACSAKAVKMMIGAGADLNIKCKESEVGSTDYRVPLSVIDFVFLLDDEDFHDKFAVLREMRHGLKNQLSEADYLVAQKKSFFSFIENFCNLDEFLVNMVEWLPNDYKSWRSEGGLSATQYLALKYGSTIDDEMFKQMGIFKSDMAEMNEFGCVALDYSIMRRQDSNSLFKKNSKDFCYDISSVKDIFTFDWIRRIRDEELRIGPIEKTGGSFLFGVNATSSLPAQHDVNNNRPNIHKENAFGDVLKNFHGYKGDKSAKEIKSAVAATFAEIEAALVLLDVETTMDIQKKYMSEAARMGNLFLATKGYTCSWLPVQDTNCKEVNAVRKVLSSILIAQECAARDGVLSASRRSDALKTIKSCLEEAPQTWELIKRNIESSKEEWYKMLYVEFGGGYFAPYWKEIETLCESTALKALVGLESNKVFKNKVL